MMAKPAYKDCIEPRFPRRFVDDIEATAKASSFDGGRFVGIKIASKQRDKLLDGLCGQQGDDIDIVVVQVRCGFHQLRECVGSPEGQAPRHPFVQLELQ